MRSQERAFRVYYAAMTDAELLRTAANRSSFLTIAQKLLGEELGRRHLSESAAPAAPIRHSFIWVWGDHLAKIARRFHHPHHPMPT